jgi:G3E family GTPase
MQMLLNQPLLRDHLSLDSVVTTVDALHAERQLTEHEEAFKQVVLADRLVLTKTDLCDPERAQALERRIGSLNPGAAILRAHGGEVTPQRLFGVGRLESPAAAQQWLSHRPTSGHASGHRHGVRCHDLAAEQPLPWRALERWLRALRIGHADRLLRLKGIVQLQGETAPVAIHGVHHVLHPPMALPHLAGDARGTRLVLITRGVKRGQIEAAWRAFLAENDQAPVHC